MSISDESDSESGDELMMPPNGATYVPFDTGGGKGPLKKGPWTSEEDDILRDYVTKNGEGNWNAVQKNSGLSRCGKSCRLRWANHLRPDLKKGAFTEEEERLVVELHATMGNKWARMAVELPGRTDNEIKNFWNTRTKRRQRNGLPIYPSDVLFQASNTNQQQINDTSAFSPAEIHLPPNFIPPMHNIQIPTFKNKNFEVSPELYPPAELNTPLDILTSSLVQRHHPLYPNKRLRTSEPFNPSINPVFVASLNDAPSSSVLISSSEELPSLQTHIVQTQIGSWGSNSSSLPPVEPDDNLMQTPPTECDIGVLDSEFYAPTMEKLSNYGQQIGILDTPFQDVQEAKWGVYDGFYHSSPMFNEGTPISGISLDDSQFVKIIPECKVQEARNMVPMQYDNQVDTHNQLIFYPSDNVLLNPNYFGPQDPTTKECKVTGDEIGKFLCDDSIGDYQPMDNGLQVNGQWNHIF